MSTLESFHLFPTLPSELRLKIWGFALSVPRTVDVCCKKLLFNYQPHYARYFLSSTPPPAPLYVCQESRHEALSFYTRAFNTITHPSYAKNFYDIEHTVAHSRYIYVNYDVDKIRLPGDMFIMIDGVEQASIQWLSLEIQDTSSYYFQTFLDSLYRYRALKRLSVLIHEVEKALSLEVDLMEGICKEHLMLSPGWKRPDILVRAAGTEESILLMSDGNRIRGWKEEYAFELCVRGTADG